MNPRALAIDLFCGLGGWAEGLLAEGWDVIGFDIERHVYGEHRYPAQLVIQDVLTLQGSQFLNVDLIVASPPCQFFSYTAMPWTRAKALAAAVRADPVRLEKELALFNACFRIQREACEAAGRHIPMVVENVRGAIPWVGRSRWNFGSFHLWGDVPALMPHVRSQRMKFPADCGPRKWSEQEIIRLNDGSASAFHQERGIKGEGSGFGDYAAMKEGVKQGGDWFNASQPFISRMSSSKSPARKAASAMIAKIPEPLARYIAKVFRPDHLVSPSVRAA